MDDGTTPPPARCVVTHACEPSRLQGQLLARAYQQVFPEARRSLPGRFVGAAGAAVAPAAAGFGHTSTAARRAAGA
jgi:hypothetical protein